VNYRIKCKHLQTLCDLLRGLTKKGIDNGTISKGSYCRYINKEVKEFFLKRHMVIDKEELQEIYDIKDYINVSNESKLLISLNMGDGVIELEDTVTSSTSNKIINIFSIMVLKKNTSISITNSSKSTSAVNIVGDGSENISSSLSIMKYI